MPSPPAECNCATLRKASRRISQLYDGVLAPCGLKITQLSILRVVARLGGASLNQLAAELVMDRSTVGHNLRPLERDGLLALAVDPADRRGRRVQLTRAGRAKLVEATTHWTKAQAGFEAAYGPARAAMLRTAIHALLSDDFVAAFQHRLPGKRAKAAPASARSC